jgi:uncharacterized protein (TIGR00255 family)
MTAFAREELRGEMGALSWEIRAVNHRYLEVFLRLPEELRGMESAIRDQVNTTLGRGKVECTLKFKPSQENVAQIELNTHLISQLLQADRSIAVQIETPSAVSSIDLLRWPGVVKEKEQDLTPLHQQVILLLQSTLESLLESRRREGQRLAELIQARCKTLREQVLAVRGLMPTIRDGIKQRIQARLLEVMDSLDEFRLEQEMAIIAQRLDVDEEMDRLESHLDEVERVLRSEEPVGRRLDFLMQELNREANTLSSKSSDVEVTRVAVEMKVLIEQMREQVQNIE